MSDLEDKATKRQFVNYAAAISALAVLLLIGVVVLGGRVAGLSKDLKECRALSGVTQDTIERAQKKAKPTPTPTSMPTPTAKTRVQKQHEATKVRQ